MARSLSPEAIAMALTGRRAALGDLDKPAARYWPSASACTEDRDSRKIAADIDRADLVTCEAVLERLTSALAARNPRTG